MSNIPATPPAVVTVYERGRWIELKVVYSAVVSERTAKGMEYSYGVLGVAAN